MNNIIDYCELFYSAHYLPIILIRDDLDECISFSSFNKWHNVVIQELDYKVKKYPAIINSVNLGFFGVLKTNDYYLIIGPAITRKKDNNEIKIICRNKELSENDIELLKELLFNIPTYTYNSFYNLLVFLEYDLNGKKLDLENLFFEDFNLQTKTHKEKTINMLVNDSKSHGTYYFEQTMLKYIKDGDIISLNKLFSNALKTKKLNEGIVGDSELRQAKNIFIGLISLVGKTAAIEGGLGIEETYNLIDEYSLECEKCSNIKQVKNLQLNALIDITNRINDSKHILTYSNIVRTAVNYIKFNAPKITSILDVVSYVNVSKTKLSTIFKKETGKSINEYINEQKLNEAALLLCYSDKTILDISLFLGYSSQSYFNNKFKEKYNLTPMQYRNTNKH